jgi:hypothetical protein
MRVGWVLLRVAVGWVLLWVVQASIVAVVAVWAIQNGCVFGQNGR